jgi:glycine/D-amino acid oxidase-like deaminating enzyme
MTGMDTCLWTALSPAPPPTQALAGQVRADVAIVGAGILGLSLALHLAEAGIACTLVEAGELGHGASGRNTGFVVPSFTAGNGPVSVAARLGAASGDRLSRLVGGSADLVFATIGRCAIACAAEQTGWLQPAHTAERVRLLERRVREWQALGQNVTLLDQAETRRLTGNPAYLAALLDRSGGQINPLAYTLGLARAAIAAGAAVHTQSPVTGYRRDGSRWRLDTSGGSVQAARIVFTTNAMAGRLLPPVTSSLIRARPHQVATQVLDSDVLTRILPERQPVSDLHRHTFAYRISPDNRLVTGGLAVLNDRGATARIADYFLQRLHRYLPGLPPLRAEYAWNGVVATTADFLPAVWQIAPGVLAPIGCNGRGVAVATALGQALAAHLATGAALPSPAAPPQPRRFHALLQFGPSLWLGWNRLVDNAEDRAATRAAAYTPPPPPAPSAR